MDTFDIDEIDVRIEGENDDHDRPVRSVRASSDAAADRGRAARVQTETQRQLLALERSKAGSRVVELSARQESAQHDLRAADEVEDADRRAEAYGRIAALEAQKLDAQRRLEYLNSLPEPQISDPVERFASSLTQRSADWVREHSDYVTDPRKNAKLTSAHWDAVGEGLQPDTDAYFDHVERAVGLRGGNGSNRSDSNMRRNSSNGVTEVRLSRGEVDRANDGSIVWGRHDLAAGRIKDASLIGKAVGNVEYARRKNEMQKQGYYERI
jgi:hypothetical protein